MKQAKHTFYYNDTTVWHIPALRQAGVGGEGCKDTSPWRHILEAGVSNRGCEIRKHRQNIKVRVKESGGEK